MAMNYEHIKMVTNCKMRRPRSSANVMLERDAIYRVSDPKIGGEEYARKLVREGNAHPVFADDSEASKATVVQGVPPTPNPKAEQSTSTESSSSSGSGGGQQQQSGKK